jgi:excisionase family DNA binding protein
MPRTSKKQRPPTPATVPTAPIRNGPPEEVMTLKEAAAYLRLPEADVLRLVDEQGLPARRMGKDWRFLKTAVQDWLRTGPGPQTGKEAQLAVIGAWKDDPYVQQELAETYRRRGRSKTEGEE